MSSVIDGHRLRALRKARGWDQQTLARTAGVAPSVVSRLERELQDDLSASVLVALARSLETSVDGLLIEAHQHVGAELIPELSAALADLVHLPTTHQRQLAAILRAYLSSFPDDADVYTSH